MNWISNRLWNKRQTAMVWVPCTDPDTYERQSRLLFDWRTTWVHAIDFSFTDHIFHRDGCKHLDGSLKVAVVLAGRKALKHFPSETRHEIIPDLDPVWGLAARVKDEQYDSKGVIVRGSKHFAAGAEVYPHRRFSGDGYARTYVTGLQKETGKYATVVMGTDRFEEWRAVQLENPHVIFRMRYCGQAGWNGEDGDEQKARAYVASMTSRA